MQQPAKRGEMHDAAAERKTRKTAKHADVGIRFFFQLFESMHEAARQFLSDLDLARKITNRSGDDGKGLHHLFPCISVLLHRFNSLLLHGSFVAVYCSN